MGKKLDKLIEGYKPIPMRRMFYPRGMKLSEDFINAFHREYDRLVDEGLNPKSLVERFGKSLKFHAGEPRIYHQIDEENARLAALEEKNKQLPPWLDDPKDKEDEDDDKDEDVEEAPEGDRGEAKREGKRPTDKDKDTKSKSHKKKHK